MAVTLSWGGRRDGGLATTSLVELKSCDNRGRAQVGWQQARKGSTLKPRLTRSMQAGGLARGSPGLRSLARSRRSCCLRAVLVAGARAHAKGDVEVGMAASAQRSDGQSERVAMGRKARVLRGAGGGA